MGCESLEQRQLLALVVEAFTPTPSGFVARFNEAVETSGLSLFDAQNQALGQADVTLSGATVGNVTGSLVVENDQLTFIRTGGPLAPDTYTLTLRSAANGIRGTTPGDLLDGEFSGAFPSGNGSPGGDFTFSFTVSALPALVVTLPDFARGPGQGVDVPAQGSGQPLPTGLPIQLQNAAGVTSFNLKLTYNPALVNLTAVELGPDAPEGSQVVGNFTTAGEVTLAFFSLDPLDNDARNVITLTGTVPDDATYGAAHVLDISELEVNAGAMQGVADDALHVVAIPGDANANRRYDTEDARLIARVGVGLDTGLAVDPPHLPLPSQFDVLYPTIDPVIIGDVTGADGLSPLDASDILRRVVGLPTPNIPALPSQQAPTNLALSAVSVAESAPVGAVVGTFTTTDPDAGDTHTYSLVSGAGDADNASFSIQGNQLRTAAVFDFETKNSFTIRVRTTDQTGRSFERTFSINVTNVNEAPTAIALSNSSIAENSAIGTVVGVLSATDPDTGSTHTFTLVAGEGDDDNASFTIDGNELKTAAVFDFETQNSFIIRVRAADQGGLSFEQVLTVSVTDVTEDVNEAPTALALSNNSVAENAPAETVVGEFTTTDPDAGDTHTYTLVTGEGDDDNASFVIEGDQLQTAEAFDFETKNSFTVRVRTTDQDGLFFEQSFTITVSDVNEAPTALTLDNDTVAENEPVGTVVGVLGASDPDLGDTLTFTLVTGEGDDDNASFTIDGDVLRTAEAFDFETKDTYTLRVRVEDQDGFFADEVFTITVTDANEAPTNLVLDNDAVAENEPAGAVVGVLSATDPDFGDTLTFSLVAGEGDDDNASFTIDGDELKTAEVFDFEAKNSYTVRIRAEDPDGAFVDQVFTITVTDVNEAPIALAIDNNTVGENEPVETVVGVLGATDPDAGDTHTFTLVAGEGDDDNASFTIDGDQLKTAEVFDFEAKNSYTVRVRTTDRDGLFFEQIRIITVSDVNEAPTALELDNDSVAENEPVGSAVGVFTTTDPDVGDTHTYSLAAGVGDDDNASFTIDGDTLKTAEVFDFETKDSYTIRVRSEDQDGLFFEQTFTITIADAANAVALSNAGVAENEAVGTVVGELFMTEPEAGDTFTFTLVAGEGDDDNASFTIDGAELKTAEVFDFETRNSYAIRVRSENQDSDILEQVFTITVTDVNEAPTSLALDNDTVAENEPAGTAVGVFTTTDPDLANTHSYTLVAGAGDDDNASFTIDGDTLRTAEVLDFEAKDSYTIRVRSEDQDGLFVEQTFTITVTEVNEAPAALALDNATVAENEPTGTVVGVLSATDPDTGDVLTFSLVAGEGDNDNVSFTIDGNELKTAESFDFETKDSYTVRVRVEDQDGLFTEDTFTITVANVNESPTNLQLSNATAAENEPAGTVVGALSATDPDAGDLLTFTLVTGEGDDDNASFVIDGNELKTAETFDFEARSSYSVRVRVEDQEGAFFEQIFTITVTNVNEAPTGLSLDNDSVAEDQPVGTVVGVFTTTDPDTGDTHTYTLVAGEGDDDNASFTIDGNELKTAEVFDAEVKNTYKIRVRSEDQDGAFVELVFVITITA